MIDLSQNFGYNKQYYTIPASSMYTVEFTSIPSPNYFRVNNSGKTTIYCSTQGLPTTENYSFKVDGNSVANFTEPHSRSKLYIYNPSKEVIKISITYWCGEFDPSFLGLSEITINPDVTLKTDGMINGFAVPLPAGSNKIGSVDISSIPEITLKNGGAINLNINNAMNKISSVLNYYDWVELNEWDEEISLSLQAMLKKIYEKMGTGSNVDMDELKSFIDFNTTKIVAENDDILSIGDVLYLMLPSIETIKNQSYNCQQYLQEISQKISTLIQKNGSSFIQTFDAKDDVNIISVDSGYYVGKFICSNLSNNSNAMSNFKITYTVNGVTQLCTYDYWNSICDSVKLSVINVSLSGYALSDVTFEVCSK